MCCANRHANSGKPLTRADLLSNLVSMWTLGYTTNEGFHEHTGLDVHATRRCTMPPGTRSTAQSHDSTEEERGKTCAVVIGWHDDVARTFHVLCASPKGWNLRTRIARKEKGRRSAREGKGCAGGGSSGTPSLATRHRRHGQLRTALNR